MNKEEIPAIPKIKANYGKTFTFDPHSLTLEETTEIITQAYK